VTIVDDRRLAVVTGASSGIGRELARLAARDGHPLLLVARRGDALAALGAELADRYKVVAEPVVADLADPSGVPAVVEAVAGRPVDVLVNNAGVGGEGRFAVERELAADLAMVRLNVTAVVELTGHLLPGMVKRGRGGVLNVASTAAYVPGPLQAVYYASKAFVKSFSEALTEETRGTGVRVTALCPGPVDTGFAAAAGLEGSRLTRLRALKVPAPAVAAAGWRGLAAGRPVVVPGLPLRVGMGAVRFTPRRLAARMAERSHRH
jgi:short-subunit dehydrogenase